MYDVLLCIMHNGRQAGVLIMRNAVKTKQSHKSSIAEPEPVEPKLSEDLEPEPKLNLI